MAGLARPDRDTDSATGRRGGRGSGEALRAGARLGPSVRVPLPRQLTTFVGRERELTEVVSALHQFRLVTVCGPGGSGKTRLALAAAERLLPEQPDGVFLVELADVSDPQLVASSVASALGVGERPEIGIVASLEQALRQAQLLVILDSCEHLVEACAALSFDLLEFCPELRLLITSREPLGVPGELAWRLPALPIPQADDALSVEELTSYDSVRLFVERAQSFQPSFALTADHAQAVARVCELTEGIPLAIELAAGRLPTLAVEQIADQLSDALAVLTTGSRLSPPRQRTLRATIDWSYERLTPSEQTLFNRLSVFSGPASLEAVRAVCADAALPSEEILDTLARLIDKSLVQAEAVRRELRYRLLELLRQYARKRLDVAGESQVLRARHAAYFATLADPSSELQARARFPELAQLLADDRQNIRAALAWSLQADPDQALLLVGGLSRFWHTMSHLAEGRRWLERALAATPGEPAVRARALHGAGQLVYRQGDCSAAQAFLTEALGIHRRLGDQANVAWDLRSLGLVLLSLGDYSRAGRCLEEALAIHERLGDQVDMARTLGSLALVAMADGRYDAARERLHTCVELAQNTGDEWALATAIGVQGELALEVGDHEAAQTHLQVSVSLLARLADEASVAYRLEGFARLAALRGQHTRALTLAAAGAAARARVGSVAVPHWRRRLDQAVARCRRHIGPRAADAAHAAGSALTVDEAITYALEEGEPAGRRQSRNGAEPAWASSRSRAAGLSAREWDVLGLLMTGLSNRLIAARLSISPNTVNKHVASILEKLAARSRSQAIAIVLGLEPSQ